MSVPWLENHKSTMCLQCGAEFGFFTWRHHCRHCGGLFCANCADRKVKTLPGSEGKEERVCDICYFNDLAYLVVYNLMLTGFHSKVYHEVDDAKKKFDQIPSYASRVVIRMGTGTVVHSWFKNESWEKKVMDHCEAVRRLRLRPRIPLTWHADGGIGISASQPRSEVSVAAPVKVPDVFFATCVVWQQQDAPALEHHWILGSGPNEDVKTATTWLNELPAVAWGAVTNHDGRILHLRAQGQRDTVVEAAVQRHTSAMSCLVAWHSGGEIKTQHHGQLPLALQHFSSLKGESAVLMDMLGNVISSKNCTTSWLEALLRGGGEEMLRIQGIIVCVVCFHPSTMRVVKNMPEARRMMMSSVNCCAAVYVCTSGSPMAVLFQRSPFFSKHAALALGSLATANMVSLTPSAVQKSTANRPTGSKVPECQICFDKYNATTHKPCLCPTCGNSLCLTCTRNVQVCPFCRNPMTTTVTNVTLLQLISE